MMLTPLASMAKPSPLDQLFFGDRLPASETAAWSDGLFMMITWFSIICFVVLMGLMFWFMIKYRRRPGVPAEPSPHHHTLLEVFWTVVPSSSLLVMFVLGFQGYTAKVISPDNAMELRITGFKWGWIATYPNGATSPEKQPLSQTKTVQDGVEVVTSGLSYPIFYLPEDTDVKLRMQSNDVIHSFWIPEFRTKRDVIPNRYTGYGIRTPKLTKFDTYIHQDTGDEMIGRDMWIFCAEYCGDNHSRDGGHRCASSPKSIYDAVDGREDGRASPVPTSVGRGPADLHHQVCATCHQARRHRERDRPLLEWAAPTFFDQQFGFGLPRHPQRTARSVERDIEVRPRVDPQPRRQGRRTGYAPAMQSMPSFDGLLSDDPARSNAHLRTTASTSDRSGLDAEPAPRAKRAPRTGHPKTVPPPNPTEEMTTDDTAAQP